MSDAIKWSPQGQYLMLRGNGFGLVLDMSDPGKPLVMAMAYRDGESIRIGSEFNGNIPADVDNFIGGIIRSASGVVEQ